MRIYLQTTVNKELVPFNYQPSLTGSLHKWLGKNIIHDQLSLYSFSWLQNGTADKNGLWFKESAFFFISAYDPSFIRTVIEGIRIDPNIGFGMQVNEIIIQEDPVFHSKQRFLFASPILIKRKVDNKEIHFSFNDKNCDSLMTETIKRKLRIAGMNDQGIEVNFDTSYKFPKTKLIHYNNIGNKVNLCPVIITGTPEQLAFVWNVGVGNSTGIGFGALK